MCVTDKASICALCGFSVPARDAVPILEADLTGALHSLQSACESIGQHVGTVMGELDALLAGASASEAQVHTAVEALHAAVGKKNTDGLRTFHELRDKRARCTLCVCSRECWSTG